MKKLLLALGIFSFLGLTQPVSAMDDMEIQGIVKSIDSENKTFTIAEDGTDAIITFKTNPKTEFENKNKKSFFDFSDDVNFDYLQTGDWVNVEVKSMYKHDWKEMNRMKDGKKMQKHHKAAMKDGNEKMMMQKDMQQSGNMHTSPSGVMIAKEVKIYR